MRTQEVDGITFVANDAKGAWYENGEDKVGNLYAMMNADGSMDVDSIGEIETTYENV